MYEIYKIKEFDSVTMFNFTDYKHSCLLASKIKCLM